MKPSKHNSNSTIILGDVITKLKEHTHVLQTTCKGVYDKLDLKFTQVTTIKKNNEEYIKKVITLENDMLALRQSHDKLVNRLVKNGIEQASTNAKAEIMYKKFNETNYTASVSHPFVVPVEETHDMECIKTDISNIQ